ncbi:hypothetical protein FHS16_000458 [Paenibacillus endophyticus]|uniref:Uncharacterized protein n=1 Tax=Paenibacillus endophyticus TaxID=1294268 RepID=A0A7W5C3I7_9BACL|nr:hypothetical protein [Paenibacillus endophyticus]
MEEIFYAAETVDEQDQTAMDPRRMVKKRKPTYIACLYKRATLLAVDSYCIDRL